MATTYINITGSVSTAELKEVTKAGVLVTNGIVVNGEKTATGSTIYKFNIDYSRHYSLYVNSILVTSAQRLFLHSGTDFYTNASGEIELNVDMNANNKKIKNIADGTASQDAVSYRQISSIVKTPSNAGTITMDATKSLTHVLFNISANSAMTRDTTYIFYYYIDDVSGNTATSLSAQGIVSASGKDIVQGTSKNTTISLPKIYDWKFGKFIHYGYYAVTAGGVSSVKRGTTKTLALGDLSLETSFDNLAALSLAKDKPPIIADLGSQIHITIPADQTPSVSGDFEIAYGFLPVGSATPTTNGESFTNLPIYTIQRGTARSFIINKPLLSASSDAYNIWVTYRFVNPFSVSDWWGDSLTKLKDGNVSKFSSKLTPDDLDAVLDHVINTLYADSNTGIIARK